ncbi:hypothetical protein PRUB_a0309 [Pseudoalteromonas rubra]|uniref:Uncharacterized protein n=1 Tax=Pseudoalteromonas rubra TaxID=43658 RepID=A0A8T0C7E1_9GAMM|nr:hypothetical protein PRUB_a0309 [Pseudoalteromonas rubra]
MLLLPLSFVNKKGNLEMRLKAKKIKQLSKSPQSLNPAMTPQICKLSHSWRHMCFRVLLLSRSPLRLY